MSKAARIRELIAQGVPDKEIAEMVGCLVEYVRVAGHQRTGKGKTPTEIKYRIKKFGTLQAFYAAENDKYKEYRRDYYRNRYQNDAEYREKKLARIRDLRASRIAL